MAKRRLISIATRWERYCPPDEAPKSLFILWKTWSSLRPLTLALASLGLAAVVVLASYVPALQATKVDPLVALRHE